MMNNAVIYLTIAQVRNQANINKGGTTISVFTQ